MYSMIVAEPIGIAIGILAGRVGAAIGKNIAHQLDVPDWLKWVFPVSGAMLSHYIASATTKAIINAMALDPIGGVANVTVTSPATSILDGIYEALVEIFPDLASELDLHDILSSVFEQSQPELEIITYTGDIPTINVGTSDILELDGGMDAASASETVRFSGGYQPIEVIADSQGYLPSCGLETLENMVQSANPLLGNGLSDLALSMGYQLPMPVEQYQYFLSSWGVPSQWVPFDPNTTHGMLLTSLSGNNTAALIGDPYYLNPDLYKTPGYFHAVTLRDPWIANGNPIGYIGIDSNLQGQPQYWTFEQVNNMSAQSQSPSLFTHHVLLTRNP
jgi:hypothetical protein